MGLELISSNKDTRISRQMNTFAMET